jgi:hypothetical protein
MYHSSTWQRLINYEHPLYAIFSNLKISKHTICRSTFDHVCFIFLSQNELSLLKGCQYIHPNSAQLSEDIKQMLVKTYLLHYVT